MYSTKKIYVMFSLKCMSSGQKNTTGIIVPFNIVPFNFVLKSSMSWHCFEIKRIDMHVSEFLNTTLSSSSYEIYQKNSQKHRICLEDNGSREMLHLRALQRLRCESRV